MAVLHNLIKIKADANGAAPKTIELLRAGTWKTPWHGDFEITTSDLHQFVANAKEGVGLVAADPKVPGNYGHMSGDKAAGWIDPQAGQLYVSEDGQALVGEPQWTPAAQEAIQAGEWAYISPEFNPRSVPWEDPEERTSFVDNVITGFALTNIPLFKKLKPVQASRVTGSSDTSTKHEGDDMDLATVRAKEVKDLTDEEKAFLAEHKADLTADEQEKFGLADDTAGDDKGTDDSEDKQDDADKDADDDKSDDAADDGVKGSRGTVSISADRLAKLEAAAQAGLEAAATLAHKEASEFATAAIKAGRIKSDQKDSLVERLVKASKEDAKFLKDFVEGLPKNEQLGKESGVNASAGEGTAQEAVFSKARDLVAADSTGKLTFQAAVFEVMKADKELATKFDKETNGKKGQ